MTIAVVCLGPIGGRAELCRIRIVPKALTGQPCPLQISSTESRLRSRDGSSGLGRDYVVVGAGAAGCVVAGRLSQMLPDARIALIEAGGERLGLTTKVPGTAFVALVVLERVARR